MHLWAQADHYALANGFVQNNLDFFHPQTFVYNHQFPNGWLTADSSNITAVDFPIHQYIVGAIMKITGSNSPAIYRIYMLLLAITGLIYLFRISLLFNKSVWFSSVITAFVAFTPVFLFYQIRFIPSVPSLSTCIIGCFYYFQYRKSSARKDLYLFVFFLTLAALTRLTFIIPLLSIFGVEFLRLIKDPRERTQKVLLGVTALATVLSYMAYNSYLRKTYGSLFLNELMPAKSFSEFILVTKSVLKTWKWEYLSLYHYLLVGISFALLLVRFFRKKTIPYRQELGLVILMFSGSALFYLVMCVQFMAHDYYFIDTFLLPVALLLVVLSPSIIQSGKMAVFASRTMSGALVLGMVYSAFTSLKERDAREKWGPNETIIASYNNSAELLKKLSIPKSVKILVLTPSSPNIPFLFMKRTGYATMKTDRNALRKILRFPVRYVVFENDLFIPEIYTNYPEVVQELQYIGTNGKITFCKKEYTPGQTLYGFLQLDKKLPLLEASTAKHSIQNFEFAGHRNDTSSICYFNSSDETGPVLKLRDARILHKNRIVYVEGDVKINQLKNTQFVISLVDDGQLLFYKTLPIPVKQDTDGWRKLKLMVTLPPGKTNSVELAAYIMNSDHQPYAVRNFRIAVY
jgi:hypothetical protein